jgi:hypothetical protein
MATKELDERGRRYRLAYTLYMPSVHEVADAVQRGEWLSREVEAAEEKAFNELVSSRQAVLDALYVHLNKKT